MGFNQQIMINNKEYQVLFTKEEILILNEFVHIVKEIQLEDILNHKFNISVNISGSVGDSIQIYTKLPDSMSLSALLHKVRPLILKQERTFLYKIIGTIAKNIDDVLLRKYFKVVGKQFQIASLYQPYQLRFEDKDILTEETFFLWLNGYEYHRDKEKKENLEPIIEAIGKDFFTANMINILIDKFNAIQKIASFVEEIIVNGKTTIELKRGD